MTERHYDENTLNELPYSKGFGNVPVVDVSLLIVDGESPIPITPIQEGFVKLEGRFE